MVDSVHILHSISFAQLPLFEIAFPPLKQESSNLQGNSEAEGGIKAEDEVRSLVLRG